MLEMKVHSWPYAVRFGRVIQNFKIDYNFFDVNKKAEYIECTRLFHVETFAQPLISTLVDQF
ncbi:hypothetical protein C9J12_12495 [Photobacterium frigidiphilum]|uniref:Uncharacterized protein n=1 Tax=Photobacterium frigidiphilum TaxID=264736 RepID=A0A2T3JGE3_9GAMM|nr:hypothetical protein C9J12_12495 [Photobacterium frigidiphilum]